MTDFLAELVVRLLGKTPHFFKIIRMISIIIAIITGLPTFLQSAGVDLPAAWDSVVLQVISIAGMVGAFISQLTVTTEEKTIRDIKD
jgi:carbon starvation protein CstA